MRTCEYWKDWQPKLDMQGKPQSITSLGGGGGDLNLPCANWNGKYGCNSGTQGFINSLAWENGFTHLVDSQTRGDGLLDVYLVRPESLFTSSSIVQWISDNYRVIEWEEICCVP
jgi:hypothetical protein